jgi:hypothetical protein
MVPRVPVAPAWSGRSHRAPRGKGRRVNTVDRTARTRPTRPGRTRIGIRLAMAVTLAVAGLVGFAPSPASAATCYGAGCDYWDPQVTGCSSGATTLEEFTWRNWRVELRFSQTCAAAWTRVTANQYSCAARYLMLAVYTSSSGAGPQSTRVTAAPSGCLDVGQSRWTAMAPFSYWVAACLSNDTTFATPNFPCTRRR